MEEIQHYTVEFENNKYVVYHVVEGSTVSKQYFGVEVKYFVEDFTSTDDFLAWAIDESKSIKHFNKYKESSCKACLRDLVIYSIYP